MNGITLETGCVSTDFCNLKVPTSSDYLEHNCRTCNGVDICNSRFLKPQGLTPIRPTQSTAYIPLILSTTETQEHISEVPVQSQSGISKLPVSTEAPSQLGNPSLPPTVTSVSESTTQLPTSVEGDKNLSSHVNVTQNPSQTIASVASEKPAHSKPNSASTAIYSATLFLVTTSLTVCW